jgi:hypothetical protein
MAGKVIRITRRHACPFIRFLVVCGCRPEQEELPACMQPELLYLRDHPYRNLYIEVDTVEGVEVPQQWLDEMETFLAKRIRRPG